MIHTFLDQILIHVIEIAPDFLDQFKRNSINKKVYYINGKLSFMIYAIGINV